MQMTVESIIEIVKKIVDISIVWAVFYYILKNVKMFTRLYIKIKKQASFFASLFIHLYTIFLFFLKIVD